MYASLGCGALSAKCTAEPNIHDYFVSLGVTLDSAETPFAKTPFSWFLIWVEACNHAGLVHNAKLEDMACVGLALHGLLVGSEAAKSVAALESLAISKLLVSVSFSFCEASTCNHARLAHNGKRAKVRVPQKEVGKRSSITFFVFGTLSVTFWSLF